MTASEPVPYVARFSTPWMPCIVYAWNHGMLALLLPIHTLVFGDTEPSQGGYPLAPRAASDRQVLPIGADGRRRADSGPSRPPLWVSFGLEHLSAICPLLVRIPQ